MNKELLELLNNCPIIFEENGCMDNDGTFIMFDGAEDSNLLVMQMREWIEKLMILAKHGN